jgi:DNA-binding beta-propeller fold protein YncE
MDGNFYMLDGPGSLVRIYNPVSNSLVRSVAVAPNGTTIAVAPDSKQFWITHTNPQSVTAYTGDATNGYVNSATVSTNASTPTRAYMSPTGSFVAITNVGGWVDFIH